MKEAQHREIQEGYQSLLEERNLHQGERRSCANSPGRYNRGGWREVAPCPDSLPVGEKEDWEGSVENFLPKGRDDLDWSDKCRILPNGEIANDIDSNTSETQTSISSDPQIMSHNRETRSSSPQPLEEQIWNNSVETLMPTGREDLDWCQASKTTTDIYDTKDEQDEGHHENDITQQSKDQGLFRLLSDSCEVATRASLSSSPQSTTEAEDSVDGTQTLACQQATTDLHSSENSSESSVLNCPRSGLLKFQLLNIAHDQKEDVHRTAGVSLIPASVSVPSKVIEVLEHTLANTFNTTKEPTEKRPVQMDASVQYEPHVPHSHQTRISKSQPHSPRYCECDQADKSFTAADSDACEQCQYQGRTSPNFLETKPKQHGFPTWPICTPDGDDLSDTEHTGENDDVDLTPNLHPDETDTYEDIKCFDCNSFSESYSPTPKDGGILRNIAFEDVEVSKRENSFKILHFQKAFQFKKTQNQRMGHFYLRKSSGSLDPENAQARTRSMTKYAYGIPSKPPLAKVKSDLPSNPYPPRREADQPSPYHTGFLSAIGEIPLDGNLMSGEHSTVHEKGDFPAYYGGGERTDLDTRHAEDGKSYQRSTIAKTKCFRINPLSGSAKRKLVYTKQRSTLQHKQQRGITSLDYDGTGNVRPGVHVETPSFAQELQKVNDSTFHELHSRALRNQISSLATLPEGRTSPRGLSRRGKSPEWPPEDEKMHEVQTLPESSKGFPTHDQILRRRASFQLPEVTKILKDDDRGGSPQSPSPRTAVGYREQFSQSLTNYEPPEVTKISKTSGLCSSQAATSCSDQRKQRHNALRKARMQGSSLLESCAYVSGDDAASNASDRGESRRGADCGRFGKGSEPNRLKRGRGQTIEQTRKQWEKF